MKRLLHFAGSRLGEFGIYPFILVVGLVGGILFCAPLWLLLLSWVTATNHLHPLIDAIPLFFKVVVGLFLTKCGHDIIQFSRKSAKHRDAVAFKRDKRPPVLYLRPFPQDRVSIREWRISLSILSFPIFPLSEEQVLEAEIRKYGRMVALSSPGTWLPELGATRLDQQGRNWQAQVCELIDVSQLTIACVGGSDSLLWEINAVVQKNMPERLMLYIPSHGSSAYAAFRSRADGVFPRGLPIDPRGGRFIYFNSTWDAFVIHTPKHRTEHKTIQAATRAALAHCEAFLSVPSGIGPVRGAVELAAVSGVVLGLISIPTLSGILQYGPAAVTLTRAPIAYEHQGIDFKQIITQSEEITGHDVQTPKVYRDGVAPHEEQRFGDTAHPLDQLNPQLGSWRTTVLRFGTISQPSDNFAKEAFLQFSDSVPGVRFNNWLLWRPHYGRMLNLGIRSRLVFPIPTQSTPGKPYEAAIEFDEPVAVVTVKFLALYHDANRVFLTAYDSAGGILADRTAVAPVWDNVRQPWKAIFVVTPGNEIKTVRFRVENRVYISEMIFRKRI